MFGAFGYNDLHLGPENLSIDQTPKEPKKMSFFKKFVELQLLMLQHNAGLTSSHPYASGPINWPFLISGISFWTENDTQKQIYLIGNIIGWWTCVIALSIYVGIVGADLLARRRGIQPIPDGQSTCSLSKYFHFNFQFSRSWPSMELCWILPSGLGCTLPPLLPYGSTAFHPPLPAITSRVCTPCWFRSELHPL